MIQPKRVYISGPITGVKHNRENFSRAEEYLKSFEMEVVNPIKVEACADQSCLPPDGMMHSWECFMKHDLRDMLGCDTIYMLANWEKSRGALLEIFVARSVGMRVLFERDQEL